MKKRIEVDADLYEKLVRTIQDQNDMVVQLTAAVQKQSKLIKEITSEHTIIEPQRGVVDPRGAEWAVFNLLNGWIDEPYVGGETLDKMRFSIDVVSLVKRELGER